jgi:hypothetical protein
MNVLKRGCYILSVLAPAIAAHASLSYSNIDANITFEDNSSSNLSVIQGANSLDIFATDVPMAVGAGTNHTSAVLTVNYDATSTFPLTQMDWVNLGFTQGTGEVNWVEKVFDSQNNLLGTGIGHAGSQGSFISDEVIQWPVGVDTIHVENTYTLDLNGSAPGLSVPGSASLGLIEQNAVPEPASMAALAIGGLGLLGRRRRK